MAPTFVAPLVPSDPTTLTFELVVEDDLGATDADEVVVTVQANPAAEFPTPAYPLSCSTGKVVGVEVLSGGQLVALRPVDPLTLAESPDMPQDLPYGLLDMQIKTGRPGGTVTVRVYLDGPAPADYRWYKFDSVDGWTDFGANAVFNAARDQVRLTLVDGWEGDGDGVENGIIADTSALGSPIDSDGDGVSDLLDECPGFDDTIDVDNDGTPDGCDSLIDSDGDGVADSLDVCSGSDDSVDVDGDGTPDGCDDLIDSDGDGVSNSLDACPGHDDSVDVDADGTPDGCDGLIDSDGDGVADNADTCPRTTAGAVTVDGTGCEFVQHELQAGDEIIVMLFASDSGVHLEALAFQAEVVGLEVGCGMFNLVATVGRPGASLTITLTFIEPLPADYSILKQIDGVWAPVPATFAADRRSAEFTVVDGGTYDEDETADGTIVDPFALGRIVEEAPATSGNNGGGGGGGGGCFLQQLTTH
jgi:hypothetical protein